jgi:hypothetical protein
VRRTERWGARARIAARGFLARARQVLTTEPGEAPDAGVEESARALAGEARRLRGGVGKSAQLTGYLDAFDLEGDTRAALAELWDRMEPLGTAAIAQVVQDELGGRPADRFAHFGERPLASASLGQVHAATAEDGAELAVKVQYPDMAGALIDDLEGGRLVRALAGTALGARLSPAALDALREAVLRELDYLAEADAMDRFGRAFAGDPDIIIPRVDRAHTTGRVLSMQRIRGLTLLQVAGGPAATREAVATILLRFAWAGPLRHGLVHADPNPGNYLVLPGPPPRVAFLDHGCAGQLDEDTRERERALWSALLARDPIDASVAFRQALHAQGMVPGARSFGEAAYREWEDLVTAPVRLGRAFAWTEDHARRLLAATRRALAGDLLRIPAPVVLLWRQRLGTAAVLGLLDARADARAALEAALGRGQPGCQYLAAGEMTG